jgi:hypothetical protein
MQAMRVVDHWTGPGACDPVIRPVPLAENGHHASTHKAAFEHWYFDARLEDGRTVVGFLQSSELMTKKPGVEIHIYEPDGRRHELRKSYPAAVVHTANDRCDVRVAHNWARVSEPVPGGLLTHEVFLNEDGLELALRFESELPMWRPGEGFTEYGTDSFFGWVVAAPRAKVSGSVTVHGDKRQVRGVGYHDHNWGVGTMPKIVDHWYWGRVYAEELSCIYATIFTTERYGRAVSKPFMLARGNEIVLSTGEVEIIEGAKVYDARADQYYPSSLTLLAGKVAELELNVREVMHAHDLLDDVPVVRNPMVKLLAKPLINQLIGRPGYFRFRSDFRLSAVIGGQRVTATGSTLHEAVCLR